MAADSLRRGLATVVGGGFDGLLSTWAQSDVAAPITVVFGIMFVIATAVADSFVSRAASTGSADSQVKNDDQLSDQEVEDISPMYRPDDWSKDAAS
jgi:hypothetical protein